MQPAKKALPATKAKTPVKATPLATLPKAAIVRANKHTTVTRYPATATIKVLVATCPHKAGSTRQKAWAVMLTTLTVQGYNTHVTSPKHKYLHRWVLMGLIAISQPPVASTGQGSAAKAKGGN